MYKPKPRPFLIRILGDDVPTYEKRSDCAYYRDCLDFALEQSRRCREFDFACDKCDAYEHIPAGVEPMELRGLTKLLKLIRNEAQEN